MAKMKVTNSYSYIANSNSPVVTTCGTPGPIYEIPPLVGEINHDFQSVHPKGPAYSIGKKLCTHDRSCSPGPAYYEPDSKLTYRGAEKSPKYSIGKRIDFKKPEMSPGPSDYDIDIAREVVWTRTPKYEMGKYLSRSTESLTPAPNAYRLPSPDIVSERPSSPKYSIGQFLSGEKIEKSPGPADYIIGSTDLFRPASPKYTISSKFKSSDSTTLTPSPSHYKPELVTSHLQNSPSYTMGSIL